MNVSVKKTKADTNYQVFLWEIRRV